MIYLAVACVVRRGRSVVSVVRVQQAERVRESAAKFGLVFGIFRNCKGCSSILFIIKFLFWFSTVTSHECRVWLYQSCT